MIVVGRLARTTAILLGMMMATVSPWALSAGYSNFLELRIYELQAGQQARFLSYFEEHFLESQEVLGMRIWGQFRDLDNARQFVWLRGYRSMDERADALTRFYTSPVWEEYAPEVGAMLASRARHVHFLEPVSPELALDESLARPVLPFEEASGLDTGIAVIVVFDAAGDAGETAARVSLTVEPLVSSASGRLTGLYRSSNQSNNFPALPFIEDEAVVALMAVFPAPIRLPEFLSRLPKGLTPVESFLLAPGPRSRIRW
jgi:hypothetical protein